MFGSAPDCVLVVVDLETDGERIVYAPPEGFSIDEPTWSPDGTKIALLENRDVLVIDSHSGDVLERLENIKMKTSDPDHILSREYLAWSASDAELYIQAELPGPEFKKPAWQTSERELYSLGIETVDAIGSINLATQQVEWLGAFMTYDTTFYKRLPDGSYEPGPESLLEDPAVEIFNGSPMNPVRFLGRIVWSPAKTCYFYFNYRDGWFARTWIEGYDLNLEQTFIVRQLSWALYSE